MEEGKRIGFYFKKINDAVIMEANAQLKQLDLTFSQMEVLLYLFTRESDETILRDIEQQFHLKHPTVLGLTQRMEKKGLIQMDINPKDRRSRIVRLQPLAFEIQKTLQQKQQVLEENLCRHMQPEELELLAQLLSKMYHAVWGN